MTLPTWMLESKQRRERATPGPWANEDGPEIISTVEHNSPVRPFPVVANTVVQWKNPEKHFDNADFIAHAPTDLARYEEALELALNALGWYQNGGWVTQENAGDLARNTIAAIQKLGEK